MPPVWRCSLFAGNVTQLVDERLADQRIFSLMHVYAFKHLNAFWGFSTHFCEQLWITMQFQENYRNCVIDLSRFVYLLLDIIVRKQFTIIVFFVMICCTVFFRLLHSQCQAFYFHRCNFTCPTSKFLLMYLPSIFWTCWTCFLFKTGANKCRRVSLAWSFIFQFKFSWIFHLSIKRIAVLTWLHAGVFHCSIQSKSFLRTKLMSSSPRLTA